MSIKQKLILVIITAIMVGALCAVLQYGCISKPALINLPNITPNSGSLLGNATELPSPPHKEAMVDQLVKMFWFMCIINILFTWIAVANIKRILPFAKAWWVSIVVNILVLSVWELFVWWGWSHNHWKDVFAVGLLSWYAQGVLYDKLDLKSKLTKKNNPA